MVNFEETIMAESESTAERRRFLRVQAAKALVGALLAIGFIALLGKPDLSESLAMAGLVLPGALALLAFSRLPLPALETASHALFAATIAYLAAITGGLS